VYDSLLGQLWLLSNELTFLFLLVGIVLELTLEHLLILLLLSQQLLL